MLKDIDFKKVENLAIAIVPDNNEQEKTWSAYLINLDNIPISSILVNSRGYGEKDGKEIKTSQLRHFFELLKGKSYVKLEEINDDLHGLNNEFWISFSKNNYLFDKKYVFVPESLRVENLVTVPVIEKEGILII